MHEIQTFRDIFFGAKDTECVSLNSLNRMIADSELSASVCEKGTQDEWPRILGEMAFGDCPNKKRQNEAESLIKSYAQKTAGLILNRIQALPDEKKPQKIILCGGLSQAYTGFAIKNILKKQLLDWGISLILPRRRMLVPLLGAAALHRSEDSSLILAVDTGRILVKKALFRSREGILREYIRLPSSPGFQRTQSSLSQFILRDVIQTLADVQKQFGNPTSLSLAVGGTAEAGLPPQLSSLLEETGIRPCSVTKDVEAAAALYGSESEKNLLILLGAGIKGGFPNRRALMEHRIEGLDGRE